MRATEYLITNGLEKFQNWFDTESWYPLGRNVGASIFPGLQYTAAVIYYSLQYFGFDVPINDVCVFIPAIFGVVATIFLYLLSVEVSGSHNIALVASFVFSILPAHLMRSVAGGFDNESIALAIMVMTFYFWNRSIRTTGSWPLGILTGLSYFYMVMAWGGYIFVLNSIGVHAAVLLVVNRFSINLYLAYNLFFIIGTYGAIQLPIVGNLPFSSMEQIFPLLVFLLMQVFLILHFCKRNMSDRAYVAFKFLFITVFMALISIVLAFYLHSGRLGSFTSRIRSLFIPHTRTGNPLVDSVAEHQSTHPSYYARYLHMTMYFAPLGYYFLWSNYENDMTNGKIFLALFGFFSFYFSTKMIRLLLLLSPATSILTGFAICFSIDWAKSQLKEAEDLKEKEVAISLETTATTTTTTTTSTNVATTTTTAPKKPVAVVATSKPVTTPKPNFNPKGHSRYYFLFYFFIVC
jgi:dolichyl-diphosphooligosaccharide--protein glycosyltransferase